MNTMTEEEALNRVAAYCSAAEHCRAEVSDKLQKWGIAYDAIERILARLEAENTLMMSVIAVLLFVINFALPNGER